MNVCVCVCGWVYACVRVCVNVYACVYLCVRECLCVTFCVNVCCMYSSKNGQKDLEFRFTNLKLNRTSPVFLLHGIVLHSQA